MTLTQPQQRKVEQNLGLVGKVIKDKVHNPGQNSIYSYDDLYQIGCIGLCKAAYSDKGGCYVCIQANLERDMHGVDLCQPPGGKGVRIDPGGARERR